MNTIVDEEAAKRARANLAQAEDQLQRGTSHDLAAALTSCRSALVEAARARWSGDPRASGKRLLASSATQVHGGPAIGAFVEGVYDLASVQSAAHQGQPTPDMVNLLVQTTRAVIGYFLRSENENPVPPFGHYQFFEPARVTAALLRVSPEDYAKVSRELLTSKKESIAAIASEFSDGGVQQRMMVATHYAFTVFLQMWLLQLTFMPRDLDTFFQGLRTMPQAPDCMADGFVTQPPPPLHRLHTWSDFGYRDTWAPVQLECHEYVGPGGKGFVVFSRIRVFDDDYQMTFHWGCEDWRARDALRWVRMPPPVLP